MSGITLNLKGKQESEMIVRLSVILANYCLMKIDRPLGNIK